MTTVSTVRNMFFQLVRCVIIRAVKNRFPLLVRFDSFGKIFRAYVCVVLKKELQGHGSHYATMHTVIEVASGVYRHASAVPVLCSLARIAASGYPESSPAITGCGPDVMCTSRASIDDV